MAKRLIDKQTFKKAAGKCRFCKEDSYDLLDVHRIVPGSEGGEYTPANSVVCCSNCHRRIHAGEIVVHRYYLSTNGKNMLHVEIDGEEDFI